LREVGSTAPGRFDAEQCITRGGVRSTPGGKGVACAIHENGVDNVWIQPIDGSSGHPITHFTSGQITSFHWSPDGKSLGVLRSHS
jgi:hypothetical protein